MTGGGGEGEGEGESASVSGNSESSESAGESSPSRRKIVQDADGGNRRRAFGQLYEELGELAFKYASLIGAPRPYLIT